ncbi:putative 5-histidylcysteine sulfoxide synthase [Aliarcobacter butzleri 7h1h]|uniref:5-histidylcysteine sulfoxide synthase n=1 Tax=Aliarcobacter butzleri TaxID=28197 RepID=UPI0002DC2AFB|nr:5-histidylcysteine sulfoxide synthase [Aliarcobacter butzleri]AGR77555.1 putative 5-histidylcysteine sulfoxide synthase [Aliarcobacter butzleri 7h1h]KLE08402.1 generic methyltransferase [Aliarcobacter butzleri L354]MCG3653253.1 5-histidylcysteine sulfoxide synthase [Aliarcobacter butzleri]MDN5073436.1 5-histidylcysteine sulfoxide synthase [Aliarcobacter butzleri]MDN5121490.1 5-histidylcysteine sulfoxide synthase [Aliarcobacter butzleri]
MNYIKNSVNLSTGTIEEKRAEIKKQFLQTYELDEKLFDLLKDKEFLYQQPNKLRHPLIFYYGHTATFFINKLVLANILENRLNKDFESIFAIGVDEMSWDDLNSSNYKWPTFQEIKEYRNKVKEIVLDLIENMQFSLPINWDCAMWIILMGIEHENIHIETSSVLLRELDIKYLIEDEIFEYSNEASNEYPKNELLDVKGADVILQKDRNNPIFYGWDNEFSNHKAFIKDFQASKYLVSNGEFLEFVKEGGYNKPEFFSTEGKNWLSYTNAKYPTFWIKKDEKYFLREINRVVPLPLNYPVDVNFYEAEAFCKYKSQKLGFEVRLPSEDEYYRLYDFVDAQNKEANIGLKKFNQSRVDKYKFDDFYDVTGNVWQWSLTPIYPFDGFVTHPIYDDFTTPTFDDRHALIKGGSFISLGNETLRSARYAFRKHFFQHAGFRYVISSNEYKTQLNKNFYESDESISSYCDLYYGKDKLYTNYVDLLRPYLKDLKNSKALDLGCCVGRTSFELAKIYDEVLGIDFSANYINIGVKLKLYDFVNYKIKKEDKTFEERAISLKDFDLEKVKDKVSFMQGDACNLKEIYKDFDLIFYSSLIDKLYYPKKFLEDVSRRINKNGFFVFLSSHNWFNEYINENNLFLEFELLDKIEVSSFIKIKNKNYENKTLLMSIWKKK